MSPREYYNEDTLVQQTTADYLRDALGWDSVFAYNDETFGPDGLLGRESDREVVLTRDLRTALVKFNPGLPDEAYESAIRQLTEQSASQAIIDANKAKYNLLLDGVLVAYKGADGETRHEHLRVFDWDDPSQNRFLAVRELWIRGEVYRRRADIIGFVNGLPLVFIECKNVHKDVRNAYEKNYLDYRDTIPHIFHHNAVVMLANGIEAKIGSISAEYEHFSEWKRLKEEENGAVDMETLLKGVCAKDKLLDLFENFIIFDNSLGKTIKILAKNHQYLGVNKALSHVEKRHELGGKLGVFWHTQGSGKSYSMVFLTRKVYRKLGGNYTFLICTDREDLDTQIYKTFAGCGLANNEKDKCRPDSGADLMGMLSQHKKFVFTLVQKFNQEIPSDRPITGRDDIIVITDEAHRSQYGQLALNMRNALPNAGFLGFTGTPLFGEDEITRRVFGEYVSTYDFKRAVDDHATVPLFFDARGEKLKVATNDVNERIAEAIEEFEITDVDVQQRLERDLQREYHIITAQKRLETIAHDFVEHYSTGWETGKAMFVCIDKITTVRMYHLMKWYWGEKTAALEKELEEKRSVEVLDQDDITYRERQLAWMKETLMAVVISEEQGEVAKFRQWDLDIVPHRELLKRGFTLEDGTRLDVESAFKRDAHPFRVAIVCAMWLTGFDVPSLSTLYLDKPLKAHTLMQAIARANRVKENKNNGLIVDYVGILKNLRQALATYAGRNDNGHGGGGADTDPGKSVEDLRAELEESIGYVRSFFSDRGGSFDAIAESSGFERNAAIKACKELVNENDATRKRFEVLAREEFKKFRACLTIGGIDHIRNDHKAINLIYKGLQEDRDKADISEIIRRLHAVADATIEVQVSRGTKERVFDISKIDFDRLRQEFDRFEHKHTVVQDMKAAIEGRLHKMMSRNPLRADFQKKYQEIVNEYNKEMDKATIEQTFEQLVDFVKSLDQEETRASREGMDEETLSVLDLLVKDHMSPEDAKRVKDVAEGLLEQVKEKIRQYQDWRARESSRDAVKLAIHDYLFADQTGLPEPTYNKHDVDERTEEIYRHVYRVYPAIPSPYYQMVKG